MIRLLTRGDDFGSFHCANRAIKDAFQQGILRNTSLMVPAPQFAEAAQLCREMPGLCVGLHATINCEWREVRWGPVAGADRVPSLVLEDGSFYADPVAQYHHPARNEEIIMELEAQLYRARDAGVRIQYMDTHMGFSWFDGLQSMMEDFARREGIFLASWGKNDQSEVPLYRLPAVEGTYTDFIEEFLARLDHIDPCKVDKPYIMVTHPCYPDEEITNVTCGTQRPGDLAAERDRDRLLYMDPRVVTYCAEHEIQFAQYSEL